MRRPDYKKIQKNKRKICHGFKIKTDYKKSETAHGHGLFLNLNWNEMRKD